MPFGEVCSRIEVGDETLCGLHGWCYPGGSNTSGRVPKSTNLGTQPARDPTSSHHWGARGYPGAGVGSPSHSMRSGGTPWWTGPQGGAPWWTSPTEKLIVELAISTATVREPAEEPDIPLMQCKKGEKREDPCRNFPGWIQVLHLVWPVTPAGQTPLTLGELRWHQCSGWCLGGKRAQHW